MANEHDKWFKPFGFDVSKLASDTAAKAVDTVKETASTAVGAVSGAATSVAETATAAVNTVTETAAPVVKSVTETVVSGPALTNAATGEGQASLLDNAKASLAGAAESIKSVAPKVAEGAWNAYKRVAEEEIKEVVGYKDDSTKETKKSVLENVLKNNPLTAGAQAPIRIVEGIADRITAGPRKFVERIQAGDSTIDAALQAEAHLVKKVLPFAEDFDKAIQAGERGDVAGVVENTAVGVFHTAKKAIEVIGLVAPGEKPGKGPTGEASPTPKQTPAEARGAADAAKAEAAAEEQAALERKQEPPGKTGTPADKAEAKNVDKMTEKSRREYERRIAELPELQRELEGLRKEVGDARQVIEDAIMEGSEAKLDPEFLRQFERNTERIRELEGKISRRQTDQGRLKRGLEANREIERRDRGDF